MGFLAGKGWAMEKGSVSADAVSARGFEDIMVSMRYVGLGLALLSFVSFSSCSPVHHTGLEIPLGDAAMIDGNSTSSDGNFSVHYEANPHPDCVDAAAYATALRCPLSANSLDPDHVFVRGCGGNEVECRRQAEQDYQLIVIRTPRADGTASYCRSHVDNTGCSMEAFIPMTQAQVRQSTGGHWPN